MDPERYQLVKALFLQAQEKTKGSREEFLSRVCAGDLELRVEIEHLLLASDGDAPSSTALASPSVTRFQRRHPEAIGNFRITGICGVGGMGIVYDAIEDSTNRRVALKVIQAATLRPELVRRFRREAEILRRLRHPGIAQIFESGEFEQDSAVMPYIAMEFVDGVSLVRYAREEALGTTARLQIFLKVCDAIQYAHEQGIIHRDIKPDNILVVKVADSGSKDAPIPEPKVLDFGIARLSDNDFHGTIMTGTGQVMGSLPYMSPEQAAGRNSQISTASDIYSLGVVLYELLTHRMPYDVRGRSLPDAIEIIRNTDPTPISVVNSGFRGALEAILRKCLEKEPERRYASVRDLSADLAHHLAGEPIVARAPSSWYRLRRFTQRHRALVAGVVATITALTIGLVFAVMFALRAKQSADDAQRSALRESREAYRANLAAASANFDRDPRAARRSLDAVPEALRGWEWRYLSAQLSGLLLRFGTVAGDSRLVAVANGSLVAAQSTPRSITLWDPTIGESRATFDAPRDIVHWAATPDGSAVVAVLSDSRVVVADRRASGAFATWTKSDLPITAIAIDRSGSRVAFTAGSRLHSGTEGHFVDTPLPMMVREPVIEFDADGSRILVMYTPTGEDSLAIYDSSTLAPKLATPLSLPQIPRVLAVSADGKRFATGCEKHEVMVFDLESLERTAVLYGHQDAVTDVEFTADGRIVSTSKDGTVRLWDGFGKKEIALLSTPDSQSAVLCGNDRIVTREPQSLAYWTLTEKRSRTVEDRGALAAELQFSGDGSLLLSNSRWGERIVWNPLDLAVLKRLPSTVSTANGFDRLGEWIGSEVSGGTELVRWVDGKSRVIRAAPPLSLGWTATNGSRIVVPTGSSLMSESDKAARHVWRTEFARDATRAFVDSRELAVQPGEVLVGASRAAIGGAAGPHPRLWIGEEIGAGNDFSGTMVELIVFRGLLRQDENAAIERYLAARGAGQTAAFPPIASAELAAHFRAEREYLQFDSENRVVVWRSASGPKLEAMFTGQPRDSIRFVAELPAADRPAHLEFSPPWAVSRRLEADLASLADALEVTVFWLGDFGALGPSHYGSVPFSIGTTGAPLQSWQERDDSPTQLGSKVAQDSKNHHVASGAELFPCQAIVRDSRTGAIEAALERDTWSVALHPDGRRVACGLNDGRIAIFDLKTHAKLSDAKCHADGVLCLAYSPDGTRLASGGNDNLVRVYDADTLEPLLDLPGSLKYVSSLVFSPDGSQLVSAAADSSLHVFDTTPRTERYAQLVALRRLEQDVEPKVSKLREQLPAIDDVIAAIHSEYESDAAKERAAFAVLARSLDAPSR